jgi:hypothetical protein
MIKKVIKFKDVVDAFVKKYPDGDIWREGDWSMIDDETGKETKVRGNPHKICVVYTKGGKDYTYNANNNLDIAHTLKLMLNVGYASEYWTLQHEVERLQDQFDHPGDKNPFGFGKSTLERTPERLNMAKAALAEFEAKYTEVA